MISTKLTAQRLREVLVYDALTGIFHWRVSRGRAKVGDVAGSLKTDGYREISIDGRTYIASRLAWLYVNGSWPKNEIDHWNGVRHDNRLTNMRDLTTSGNQQNQRRASQDSQSGFLGASPHRGKFQAQITVNGKNRYLGMFETPEAAHAAYVAAKRNLHSTCTI